MYKLFIFLITLILSLFELVANFFFAKPLDSDILIFLLIGILPTALSILRQDILDLYKLREGRLAKKFIVRKSFFFCLEKGEHYTLAIAIFISLYAGIFLLIGNIEMLNLAIGSLFVSIVLSVLISLVRSIFDHS